MKNIKTIQNRINNSLNVKVSKLINSLGSMENVIVAFSGGVDSAFLLKVAHDILGDSVLAVTANSEVMPSGELEFTKEIAGEIGVKQRFIHTDELNDPYFISNPPDRCYRCKTLLFQQISVLKEKEGYAWILEGSNKDDEGDYRPGMKAVSEFGVRSPLREAELTKDEIRELSRLLELPTWDKPATPCLASRFSYGLTINAERLRAVDEAESFIKGFGLKYLRVRNHGDIARIEAPSQYIPQLISPENSRKIVERLKSLGWRYITIDLQGYRTGSLNEQINPENTNG